MFDLHILSVQLEINFKIGILFDRIKFGIDAIFLVFFSTGIRGMADFKIGCISGLPRKETDDLVFGHFLITNLHFKAS